MRLSLVLGALLMPLAAMADSPSRPTTPPPQPQPSTTTPARDGGPDRAKLVLLTDGKRHYIAVQQLPPATKFHDYGDEWHTWNQTALYYGDGKRFHAVPVRGGSGDFNVGFGLNFIDPRYYVSFTWKSLLNYRAGQYNVYCGGRNTPLRVVEGSAAKLILDGATFEPHHFTWWPFALARDRRGRYYYVDHGLTPETEKNFRLFIGRKGRLKARAIESAMSEGGKDLFAARSGTLELRGDEAEWTESRKVTRLARVPARDNLVLVFNELGVYRGLRLGTPCDDL